MKVDVYEVGDLFEAEKFRSQLDLTGKQTCVLKFRHIHVLFWLSMPPMLSHFPSFCRINSMQWR